MWVTILFWGLLYTPGEKLAFNDYNEHIFPTIALIVDFSLNRMTIDFNHWHIILTYGVIYVLFEIVWVNSVGWPIYFFSTFDSFFSWAANLSILLATVGTFFAIYYAQLLKIY